jgi:hypothetical protein
VSLASPFANPISSVLGNQTPVSGGLDLTGVTDLLSSYATTSATAVMIAAALSGYATTGSLSGYALMSSLSAYLQDITNEDLSDLSDVTVTTPANGQVLTYQGGTWVNQAPGAGYDSSDFGTDFGAKDTDDLSEGSTNLYYTLTRVNSAIDTRVDTAFVDGLGVDAATLGGLSSAAFATAAQGALADSALQSYSETSHADVVVDGDFASNGILKRTASGVYGIVIDNSANWNTAYGWGDHASAGYADGTNEANWNTAYGWGNHASAGYLNNGALYATAAQGTSADTAFGWGNHASA